MTPQRPELDTSGRVPDPHRPVPAGRGQPPVRPHPPRRHRPHHAGVTLQHPKPHTNDRVPDPHRPVPATGGHPPARRPLPRRHRRHRADVALKRPEPLTSGRVPDPHRPVPAGGRHPRTRRPLPRRHRPHHAVVALQRPQLHSIGRLFEVPVQRHGRCLNLAEPDPQPPELGRGQRFDVGVHGAVHPRMAETLHLLEVPVRQSLQDGPRRTIVPTEGGQTPQHSASVVHTRRVAVDKSPPRPDQIRTHRGDPTVGNGHRLLTRTDRTIPSLPRHHRRRPHRQRRDLLLQPLPRQPERADCGEQLRPPLLGHLRHPPHHIHPGHRRRHPKGSPQLRHPLHRAVRRPQQRHVLTMIRQEPVEVRHPQTPHNRQINNPPTVFSLGPLRQVLVRVFRSVDHHRPARCRIEGPGTQIHRPQHPVDGLRHPLPRCHHRVPHPIDLLLDPVRHLPGHPAVRRRERRVQPPVALLAGPPFQPQIRPIRPHREGTLTRPPAREPDQPLTQRHQLVHPLTHPTLPVHSRRITHHVGKRRPQLPGPTHPPRSRRRDPLHLGQHTGPPLRLDQIPRRPKTPTHRPAAGQLTHPHRPQIILSRMRQHHRRRPPTEPVHHHIHRLPQPRPHRRQRTIQEGEHRRHDRLRVARTLPRHTHHHHPRTIRHPPRPHIRHPRQTLPQTRLQNLLREQLRLPQLRHPQTTLRRHARKEHPIPEIRERRLPPPRPIPIKRQEVRPMVDGQSIQPPTGPISKISSLVDRMRLDLPRQRRERLPTREIDNVHTVRNHPRAHVRHMPPEDRHRPRLVTRCPQRRYLDQRPRLHHRNNRRVSTVRRQLDHRRLRHPHPQLTIE
ncbi:hypothetical protein B0E53_06411 [Micromonospora sp. MH33]|nr:hypothetical protein B0E53_06411 [Micromonospora sp. MH33]